MDIDSRSNTFTGAEVEMLKINAAEKGCIR